MPHLCVRNSFVFIFKLVQKVMLETIRVYAHTNRALAGTGGRVIVYHNSSYLLSIKITATCATKLNFKSWVNSHFVSFILIVKTSCE